MPQRRNNHGQYISDKLSVKCSFCGKEKIVPRCRTKERKYHFCNKECNRNWKKGKHFSLKTELKKGHEMPEMMRRKISQTMRMIRGGRKKTTESKAIRDCIETRLWREAVFARDNFTCQKCKVRGGRLHSHHIQNFAQYPELRFAIDNGITFCKYCHRKFHKKYGRRNNTKEQLKEFLR
jgi:5-methylcytosine-specific restriction endonuclease McrA